jgi:hypothetical protein
LISLFSWPVISNGSVGWETILLICVKHVLSAKIG